MVGRITSAVPAFNEHGAAYRDLYEGERLRSSMLVDSLREALHAWVNADQMPPNSRQKREALREARTLTNRVLQ